jgi:hypothetical protein
VAIRRWRRHLGSLPPGAKCATSGAASRATDYDAVLDTQGLAEERADRRQAQGRRCGYAAEAAREPLAARFYDATFVIPRNVHAVQRNRWLAAAAFDYPVDLPLDYGIAAPTIDAAGSPANGWHSADGDQPRRQAVGRKVLVRARPRRCSSGPDAGPAGRQCAANGSVPSVSPPRLPAPSCRRR